MMSVIVCTTKITNHIHAVQPGAEDYVFLIGFLISVFTPDTGGDFYAVLAVKITTTCSLYLCLLCACESNKGQLC